MNDDLEKSVEHLREEFGYAKDEFMDECGPLPTCSNCGLALGVCNCERPDFKKSADAANHEASGYPYY